MHGHGHDHGLEGRLGADRRALAGALALICVLLVGGVVTDLAAFAGTALAGGLVLATGWDRFDPIASLAVAGLMFWSAAGLLRESTRIFLEGSPGDIDPDAVGRTIVAEDGVVEVHDLHVW